MDFVKNHRYWQVWYIYIHPESWWKVRQKNTQNQVKDLEVVEVLGVPELAVALDSR